MDNREYDLELLRHQVKQGASWFYWMVGLSLVNVALYLAGANVHFIIGSSLVDMAAGVMKIYSVLGLILLVLVVGMYGGLGYAASRAARWAFVVGMAIYLMDGILYFFFEDFLSGLFHFYVLYKLYQGLQAIAPMRALEQDIAINPIVATETASDHADYMPAGADTVPLPATSGEDTAE